MEEALRIFGISERVFKNEQNSIYPDERAYLMKEYERISCHHFVELDGYAYFSNWFYNGLFQVELKTGKTVFLGPFEMEMKDEFNIHWEVFRREGLIYFLPRRGRHVHIYSLDNRSIFAIEIRKASEEFFRFADVIVEGMNLIFLPMEENAPIRKLNLNTQFVTDVMNIQDTFDGQCLSQKWIPFPMPQLLDKYQIERANKFSWKQMPNGKWCAFLPFGREILWYTPATQRIESVPLTVINEPELDSYLLPMRQKYLRQGFLIENNPLSLQVYLKSIMKHEKRDNVDEKQGVDGSKMWRSAKMIR